LWAGWDPAPVGVHGRALNYCSLNARRIVVPVKTIAVMIVMRSRFFSITVDPIAWVCIPPPNISDTPPPRPAWSRMNRISVIAAMTWTTIKIPVSI
jgi:hypothetical protein